MRRICKQTLTIAFVAAALFAPAAAARADDPVSEVTDPLTGVALDGMDPVTYFTEPSPEPGKPDFEYDWNGVPWYFANAANRDVFIKFPEIYAPQFGGHATMSLSRGFLSDGNPHLYVIAAERLYLFYSTGNRDAFMLAPGAAIVAARKNWAKFAPQRTADVAPGPVQAAAP